jgi:hypothetical protein
MPALQRINSISTDKVAIKCSLSSLTIEFDYVAVTLREVLIKKDSAREKLSRINN